MSKPIITALPRLLPVQIVNLKTGELHTWESYQAEALDPLLEWVLGETYRMFEAHEDVVLAGAETLKFSPAEHARALGLNSHHMGLGRGVRAKSRLNKLVQYKLMSETASYVRNRTLGSNPTGSPEQSTLVQWTPK